MKKGIARRQIIHQISDLQLEINLLAFINPVKLHLVDDLGPIGNNRASLQLQGGSHLVVIDAEIARQLKSSSQFAFQKETRIGMDFYIAVTPG